MTKRIIDWEVNISSGREQVDLDDLNCKDLEEWESLSEDEQLERLQECLDESPNHPFMTADGWEYE